MNLQPNTAQRWSAAVLCVACVLCASFGQDVINTVAGGGIGDGGAPTEAVLNNPYSVSAIFNVSSGGFVYHIAEYSNCRIRRINEAGIIATAPVCVVIAATVARQRRPC
ncbi:MAG: hypothetical protein EOO65_05635 [Methanosarcinales archaeon]|nr:MAG: hypothetical protein EOO65_05635 [Methanosarcinales archaeon]